MLGSPYDTRKKLHKALASVPPIAAMEGDACTNVAKIEIGNGIQHLWHDGQEGACNFLVDLLPLEETAKLKGPDDLSALICALGFEEVPYLAPDDESICLSSDPLAPEQSLFVAFDYLTAKFGEIDIEYNGLVRHKNTCSMRDPRFAYSGPFGDGFVMTFDGGIILKSYGEQPEAFVKRVLDEVALGILPSSKAFLGKGGFAPLEQLTERLEFFRDIAEYEAWCTKNHITPQERPLPYKRN